MQCRFPICDCEIVGNHRECARPRYSIEVNTNGDAIILDNNGCAIGTVHSTHVAQQILDELNAKEVA